MSARSPAVLLVALAMLAGGVVLIDRSLQRNALPDSYFADSRSNEVTVDLLREVGRARVERETTRIEFGRAQDASHYVEPDPRMHDATSGILSQRFDDGTSLGFACGEQVAVDFTTFRVADRVATLEAAGIDDGKGAQTVKVWLNPSTDEADPPCAAFELAPSERTRHEIPLAAASLRAGANRLVFEFGRTWRRSFADRPYTLPASAVFLSLDLGVPAPKDETPELATALVPLAAGPARDALVFPEGERIAFALRIPRGRPRFVATLGVHPDDRWRDRAVPLVLRLRTEKGGRLLLWKGDLDAGIGDPQQRATPEVDVDLSIYAGEVATLEVESLPPSPPAGRRARVVLAGPSLRGGRTAVPPEIAPEPARSELRARLKGMNLVVVLLDAAAARHFSAYGATRECAPAVDALALKGVTFEGVIAPASYTLPSIASLFTGLFPATHGITENGSEAAKVRLPDAVPTLAAALRDRGYSTLALVTNPNAGPEYGFSRGFAAYDCLYSDKALWHEGVAPEALAERLKTHLAGGALKPPFFLYAHVFPPHAPYRAPTERRKDLVDERYAGPVDGSRDSIEAWRHGDADYTAKDFQHFSELYDANLAWADDGVKRILGALEDAGQLERTIVAVVGDHGEAHGQHRNLEHGDTVFAEEVEVPFVLSLPESARWRPSRIKGPSSLVDVMPTLLALLSVPAPPCEGLDLTPRMFEHLVQAAPTERPLFARAVGASPRWVVRMSGYAYHEDLWTRQRMLFNVAADPLETRPLPVEGSLIAEELRAELCRFLCAREHVAGQSFQVDPAMLELQRQIGYGGGAPDASGATARPQGCPLLRR